MESQLPLNDETKAKLATIRDSRTLQLVDLITHLADSMFLAETDRDVIEAALGDVWFIESLLHLATPPAAVPVNAPIIPTKAELDKLTPKHVSVTGLHGGDIGWAVLEMRVHGNKVCRAGWNGKGMYLVYQKAYPDGIPINENTANATGLPKGSVHRFLPYIMMRTADGAFVPWLCSQTDLLAVDWQVAQ